MLITPPSVSGPITGLRLEGEPDLIEKASASAGAFHFLFNVEGRVAPAPLESLVTGGLGPSGRDVYTGHPSDISYLLYIWIHSTVRRTRQGRPRVGSATAFLGLSGVGPCSLATTRATTRSQATKLRRLPLKAPTTHPRRLGRLLLSFLSFMLALGVRILALGRALGGTDHLPGVGSSRALGAAGRRRRGP